MFLQRSLQRKCFVKFCKSILLVLLLMSIVINISFIVQTSRQIENQKAAADKHYTSVTQSETQSVLRVPHHHGDQGVVTRRVSSHYARIDVTSSKQLVSVRANDKNIYMNDGYETDRGIHVLVLNQATLGIMATRVFDTYLSNEDLAMVQFLSNVTKGRILVFAIKDEGTFQLKDKCRQFLTGLGSEWANVLHWRDMWTFVTVYGTGILGESYERSPDVSSWSKPTSISVNLTLANIKDTECRNWPTTEEMERRKVFCSNYEGYGEVCDCNNLKPLISPNVGKLADGGILDVPVAVIASNRPAYLYRMLKKLLHTAGVPVQKVTVFIDGHYDEPLDVARLLNVRGIQHVPLGQKNARISQHYKASIKATFELFPEAEYIIIIEEDLDVSPDFFSYFQQTQPLLEDPTLYCISAWNDQGYEHSCKDASLLYRIETMPGLGWMMKRSLFADELEPQWPTVDKEWDWDMWMRTDFIRKKRECIIPDISRTYHFGSKGLNINPYFQQLYFTSHKLQSQPYVKLKDIDKMSAEKYEILVRDLIQTAKVLDHTKDPCAAEFIPETGDENLVLYIQMNTATDFDTWKQLAKCYKLWDLDVRGFHKSMWRQFLHDKHLLIVGVPASPYAEYKPVDVKPINLQPKSAR